MDGSNALNISERKEEACFEIQLRIFFTFSSEASSPERTKKHGVFESPVIIPHPEKELDDGGVYKGGPASDRILKGTQ